MAGADRQLARQLWLAYFNQTLFEQGIITEAQRNAVLLRIKARKVSTLKTR